MLSRIDVRLPHRGESKSDEKAGHELRETQVGEIIALAVEEEIEIGGTTRAGEILATHSHESAGKVGGAGSRARRLAPLPRPFSPPARSFPDAAAAARLNLGDLSGSHTTSCLYPSMEAAARSTRQSPSFSRRSRSEKSRLASGSSCRRGSQVCPRLNYC